MAGKVFVSYVHQDREFAENAIHALAAKGHFAPDTVFSDLQHLSAEEDASRRVRSEIEAADAVVLVMSEHAATSPWINYEAGLADAFGKKILVVGAKDAEELPLLAKLAAYQQIELEAML